MRRNTIINLDDIPDNDPADYTIYTSAKHIGIYVALVLTKNTLIINHVGPVKIVGKTNHPKILGASDYPCDLAVMCELPGMGQVWIHLKQIDN